MVHLLTCFLNVPLKCMWSLFTQYIEARQIYPNNLLSRHLSDPGKSRPRCQINCCEVVMPNIKILFSNQIYTVLKKKSALCQAKQITICNITQSMKDSDFHFDTVWCCLCSFVCSCICIVIPVCVYVWAGMHACAYPAHEFKYLESEKKKKMECDCRAWKGYIWKTNYTTRAFSFHTAIDNLQMQPNKEE